MNGQSLANVLTLLRRIRGIKTNGLAVRSFIDQLAGQPVTEVASLKICAHIFEQIEQAKLVITEISLSEEAKEGVLYAIDRLLETFSLRHLGSNMDNIRTVAQQHVSSFVILLSAYGISESVDASNETQDIIVELEKIVESLDKDSTDPSVRSTAVNHLEILISLLKNIDLVGLEPSLTEYFATVINIRRSDIGSSEAAHKKFTPIWDRIEAVGKKIGALDRVVNRGAKFLESADKVTDLLEHFGS